MMPSKAKVYKSCWAEKVLAKINNKKEENEIIESESDSTEETSRSDTMSDDQNEMSSILEDSSTLDEERENKSLQSSESSEDNINVETKPSNIKNETKEKSSPTRNEINAYDTKKTTWADVVLGNMYKGKSEATDGRVTIKSRYALQKSESNDSSDMTEETKNPSGAKSNHQADPPSIPEGGIFTICEHKQKEDASTSTSPEDGISNGLKHEEQTSEKEVLQKSESNDPLEETKNLSDAKSNHKTDQPSTPEGGIVTICDHKQKEDGSTPNSPEDGISDGLNHGEQKSQKEDQASPHVKPSDAESDKEKQSITPEKESNVKILDEEREEDDHERREQTSPSGAKPDQHEKATITSINKQQKESEPCNLSDNNVTIEEGTSEQEDNDKSGWAAILMKLKKAIEKASKVDAFEGDSSKARKEVQLDSNKTLVQDIPKENVAVKSAEPKKEEAFEEHTSKQEDCSQGQPPTADQNQVNENKIIIKSPELSLEERRKHSSRLSWEERRQRSSCFPVSPSAHRQRSPQSSPYKSKNTRSFLRIRNNYEQYCDYDVCMQRLTSGDPNLFYGKLKVPIERDGMAFVRINDDYSEQDIIVELPLHRNRALDGDMVFVELFPPPRSKRTSSTTDHRESLHIQEQRNDCLSPFSVIASPKDDPASIDNMKLKTKVIEKMPSIQHTMHGNDDGTEPTEDSSIPSSPPTMTSNDININKNSGNEKQDSSQIAVKRPSQQTVTRYGKVIHVVNPGRLKNHNNDDDEEKKSPQSNEGHNSSPPRHRHHHDRDNVNSYHHIREIVGTLRVAGIGRNGGTRYVLVPSNKSLPEFLCKGATLPNTCNGIDLYIAEYVYGTWGETQVWPPCVNVRAM